MLFSLSGNISIAFILYNFCRIYNKNKSNSKFSRAINPIFKLFCKFCWVLLKRMKFQGPSFLQNKYIKNNFNVHIYSIGTVQLQKHNKTSANFCINSLRIKVHIHIPNQIAYPSSKIKNSLVFRSNRLFY